MFVANRRFTSVDAECRLPTIKAVTIVHFGS